MPFPKGVSGNPAGKSRIQAEFEKKCREFMDEEGWKGMLKMARSSDKKVSQWALAEIMNRGFGRAKESLDVTTRDESIYGPNELAESITELIARGSGKGPGADRPNEATA